MEPISRNITDLPADERTVLERFVGQPLSDDSKIIVQIVNQEPGAAAPRCAADYAILADLDADESDSLTRAFTERSASRGIIVD